MLTIPFRLSRAEYQRRPYAYLVIEVNGLIGMDEDGLVLQYREKTTQPQKWALPPTETDVQVVHIPLAALRRVVVRGRWFGVKLVLAAADLRAFEPFRAWLTPNGELRLTIPRAERAAAADLASSIELALSTRLLSHGG
ncbi:MAG: hypothetical protein ACJ8J0_18735 [Longimicrobiaceae bacterium]